MENFNKAVLILCMIMIFTLCILETGNKENSTDYSPKQIQDNQKTEVIVENLAYKSNELSTVNKVNKAKIQSNKSNKKSKIKVLKTYSVPSVASSFKTYMSYKCITDRSSPQYKLQQKSSSKTDENGLRYTKINGKKFIHIALGSYYGTIIGTKYRITLSTGKTFYGILADQKANAHTNSTHQYTVRNGDVIEFIIDNNKLNKNIRFMGDVSAVKKYSGKVKKIEKVKW